MIESEIQGVGAYFEYHAPEKTTLSTLQMVLLPEGYTPTKQRVPPMIFYRYLNYFATRKAWMRSLIKLETVDFNDPESLAEALKPYLNRGVVGGYTQVAKHFTFEVSQKDLQQSSVGKLPTRLNSKIKAMRVNHGYPENLVREREEV